MTDPLRPKVDLFVQSFNKAIETRAPDLGGEAGKHIGSPRISDLEYESMLAQFSESDKLDLEQLSRRFSTESPSTKQLLVSLKQKQGVEQFRTALARLSQRHRGLRDIDQRMIPVHNMDRLEPLPLKSVPEPLRHLLQRADIYIRNMEMGHPESPPDARRALSKSEIADLQQRIASLPESACVKLAVPTEIEDSDALREACIILIWNQVLLPVHQGTKRVDADNVVDQMDELNRKAIKPMASTWLKIRVQLAVKMFAP